MATELLNGGVRLERIADLMGHASWETTRIYAAVDVAALREAALPWPVQVRS
jgi:site-specific recombinase XerD